MFSPIQCLPVILLAFLLLGQAAHALHARASNGALAALRPRAGSPRMVTFVADVSLEQSVETSTGERALAARSMIHFHATQRDPPMSVQLFFEQGRTPALTKPPGDQQELHPAVRAYEKFLLPGQESLSRRSPDGFTRKIIDLQETTLTNMDLIDTNSGRGVILNTILIDQWYRVGPKAPSYNAGHAFAEKLILEVFPTGFVIPEGVLTILRGGAEYAMQADEDFEDSINALYLDERHSDLMLRSAWDISVPERIQPVLLAGELDPHNPAKLLEEGVLADRFWHVDDDGELVPTDLTGNNWEFTFTASDFEDNESVDSSTPSDRITTTVTQPASKSGAPLKNGKIDTAAPEEDVHIHLQASPSIPDFRARTYDLDDLPTDEELMARLTFASEHCPQGGRKRSTPASPAAPMSCNVSVKLTVGEPTTDPTLAEQNFFTLETVGSGQKPLLAEYTETATLVRVGGLLTNIITVPQQVFNGLGIADMVAAPLIVMLDLVGGNYEGAALGVVGLSVVGGLSLMDLGPVGSVIGGGVASMFTTLPGLSTQKKNTPPANDAVKIIRYAMFGDSELTGNEACQKMGNANCTAVYGPSILARTLGLSYLEAFALQIWGNEGYAMTVEDVAKVFHIVNPATPLNGANATAMIDCQTNATVSTNSSCANPRFAVDLTRIGLLDLGVTADQIVPRLITQVGGPGDCELVGGISNAGVNYSAYNLTVLSQKCSILCGLTSAVTSQS